MSVVDPKLMTLAAFMELLANNQRNHTRQMVQMAINDFNLVESKMTVMGPHSVIGTPSDQCNCPSGTTVNFNCPWHGLEGTVSQARRRHPPSESNGNYPVASRVADVKGDD